jgi:hypothetical protein
MLKRTTKHQQTAAETTTEHATEPKTQTEKPNFHLKNFFLHST